MKYAKLVLQSYLRPRNFFNLTIQRNMFAWRIKMTNIREKICSSKEIKKCEKCNCDLDNNHLFKCTRNNENNINYNQILNGTILEQRNAINYIIENKLDE